MRSRAARRLAERGMQGHGRWGGVRAALPLPAVLLLLLGGAPACGQEIELRLHADGRAVSAELTFAWDRWDRRQELLDEVKGGLGSRVEFVFRVQQRRDPSLPFLQEVLVSETSLARSASFDIFSAEYSVESEREGKSVYRTPEEFCDHFLTVRDLVLFGGLQPGSSYAVEAQVRLAPTKVVPPLNIISLFGGRTATYTSPWIRREVAP